MNVTDILNDELELLESLTKMFIVYNMEGNVLIKSDHGFDTQVRKSVLCAASAVLEGILLCNITGGEDVITLSGASDEAVKLFVQLAHLTAHDCASRDVYHHKTLADAISIHTDCIMLLHKYEAYGVAEYVKQVLQQEPRVVVIVSMVEFFPEDTEWLTSSILSTVLDHFCASHITSDAAVQSLSVLPHALLTRLVVFVAYAGRRNMVDKIHVFRPAIDDRLFHVQ